MKEGRLSCLVIRAGENGDAHYCLRNIATDLRTTQQNSDNCYEEKLPE